MAPPVVRVVDGLNDELVCEVALDASLTFRHLSKAINAATGIPAINLRLLWAGRSLRTGGGDGGAVMEELKQCVEPTVVRLVRTEQHWEAPLDRLAQGGAPTGPDDEALLAIPEFVSALLQEDGCAVRMLPEELRMDPEVILQAVRSNGRALSYGSAEARADRELVLLAVRSDGTSLEFAAPELRADAEVVAVAVRSSGEALRFAAETLTLNKEVCLLAIGNRSTALLHVHPLLLEDLDFVADAVRANGDAMQYVPSGLRERPEVARAAQEHWSGPGRDLVRIAQLHIPASLQDRRHRGKVG